MNILEEMDHLAKEDEVLLKEGETPQFILRYKATISGILQKRDPNQYYFVEKPGKFGFSERMVNQLMKFAYERGVEHSKQKGFEKGWDAAMKDVAEKLGLDYRED